MGFRVRNEPFAEGAGVCEVDGELRVAVETLFEQISLEPCA